MLTFFVFVLLAQADPGEGQAERERAAIRARIEGDKERTGTLRREEGSILETLRELDRRLDVQRRRVVEISLARARAELSSKEAESSREAAQSELEARRALVARRAVAMLRLKRTALADLLSRVRTPSELRRIKSRLGFVLEHDAKVLDEVRRASDAALSAERRVTNERRTLAERSAELARELETNQSLRAQRAALLAAVQGERKTLERLVAELASASKRLDAASSIPRGLVPPPPPAPGGFARQRGRLPWPVAGVVESPFGKRVEPESSVVLDHPGIDVRAPFGEPVHAPFQGRVLFAGAVPRFGRAVVLEHGDGYLTAYGHLDEPAVSTDAIVEAGDLLGTVGESGSWKGPYLYFEVRRRRTPEDPLAFLAP